MFTSSRVRRATFVFLLAGVWLTPGSTSPEIVLEEVSKHSVGGAAGAAIAAAFARESYAPGDMAQLRVWKGTALPASLRVVAVGRARTALNNPLAGAPVTPWRRLRSARTGVGVRVPVGRWPSGLYCVEIRSGSGTAFAPFVVTPVRLGGNAVAVVMPTRTWQAYNGRDDDGDGRGDTWYATSGRKRARLYRPFRDGGVPPRFRSYDLPFLRWLNQTGRAADVLAQEDLDETTGAELAAAYGLLVFPGHHEYVTEAEYDAVSGFRDRGGNLMFLSANNFFAKVDVSDGVMTRVGRWRDLGRPEAALVGAQYLGSGHGVRGSWRVRRRERSSWLFAGVPVGEGGTFSSGGIEVDAIAPSSPPGTRVVAAIPNALGRGKTAHMTYYETGQGAKAFAAGAFTLAGAVRQPSVTALMTNLWNRLARSVETPSGLRGVEPSEVRVPAPPAAVRGLAHTLRQYPAIELASAFERREATRLLAAAERTATRWRDPLAAARDGFNTKRPKRRRGETRTMWFHAESRANHSDDAYLDPTRPDTLIYADSPGRPLSLVGVMFSMPRGVEGWNPGGPITRWHCHLVCTDGVRRGLKPRADGSCPRGARLYGGSEMLHVWFTHDLRSAYAIHAPVPELCHAKLISPEACTGRHERGM